MKKIFLCVLFLMFGVISPLFAQVPEVARPLQIVRTVSTRFHPLPPIPGGLIHDPFIRTHDIVTTIDNTERLVTKTVVNPSIPNPTAHVTAARMQRSWMEQMRRNYKAARLKKEHAEKVRLAQLKADLPQLHPQQTQLMDSFEGLEFHESQLPTLPWMQEPNVLYRGMGLATDGQAIRNILENGLRIEDLGKDSNHLTMIYAGDSRGAVMQASRVRFTNLTNDPLTALHYAARNNLEGKVMVLVRVTGQPRYDKLVQIDVDIAPEQIEEMLALVSFDGMPTWCRVELQDGQFRLTPYQ